MVTRDNHRPLCCGPHHLLIKTTRRFRDLFRPKYWVVCGACDEHDERGPFSLENAHTYITIKTRMMAMTTVVTTPPDSLPWRPVVPRDQLLRQLDGILEANR